MVTYSEIIAAINTKIENSFADVEIQSPDSEEGLIRPSFRTNSDNVNTSNFMNEAKDSEITIRIYYFPSDSKKHRTELLSVQNKLEDTFLVENTIVTETGFVIEIYESEINVVDGVLHFYFDIMFSEDFNRVDTGESMDNLEYKQKQN